MKRACPVFVPCLLTWSLWIFIISGNHGAVHQLLVIQKPDLNKVLQSNFKIVIRICGNFVQLFVCSADAIKNESTHTKSACLICLLISFDICLTFRTDDLTDNLTLTFTWYVWALWDKATRHLLCSLFFSRSTLSEHRHATCLATRRCWIVVGRQGGGHLVRDRTYTRNFDKNRKHYLTELLFLTFYFPLLPT